MTQSGSSPPSIDALRKVLSLCIRKGSDAAKARSFPGGRRVIEMC
jgi:hypothetical protein